MFITRILGRLFACFIALMASAMAIANESGLTIKVQSEAWTNATESDGRGLYWDILREVYEVDGVSVHTQTSTYKRSVGLVQDGLIDIMVGAYADEVKNVVYPKHHFDLDSVAALSLASATSSAEWTGLSSLTNKHVAYMRGYELEKYLDEDFYRHEYYSRDKIFQLIHDGKMDYFIDAEADIRFALQDRGLKEKHYQIQPLKQLKLYFVFSPTEKGAMLAQQFDQRFAKMINNGRLKALYEKHQWDYATMQASVTP